MEHVEAHTMKLLGTVPAETMKSSSVHFQPGDVLYGRLRPYLNKVYRPDFEGLCSAEFIVFPNSPDVDTRYLQYFLNSYDFVSFATHLNEGDRPRVDFKQIAPYPFPLAPLPEQRRIVSAIETQLGRLDAAVARLHAAKAKLKRYKQAVLKAAVEGAFLYPDLERDELPMGWKAASLGELVEDPKYGTSKKCSADEKGVPVLRIPNIGDGVVSHADLKYASFDAKERKAYALRAGDLLTIRSNGSVDLVGKCALIREEDEHCLYAGYLIRLRPKHDTVESRYLLYHLSSFPSRVEIESKAKSTSGVNNINAQELKDLTIILPPLKDQIAICDTVDVLMSEMNSLDTAIDAQLLQASRLRQAVLKRAFEGRLV
jgi:type I restriction enzyme S subunit